MIDRGKRNLLGIGINVIDYDGATDRITAAARERRPLGATALAVHGVMTGALDEEHRYRLNRLDVVTPDGQPVRWALRLLHGEKLPDRVYGPDLVPRLCARAAAAGLGIYLYGSTPDVLSGMRAALEGKIPSLRIVGAEPSRFRQLTDAEATELDQRILGSGADIVLVGLGCPRQEVFVFEHRESLGIPMVAVGAAFDFIAGRAKQAPAWMQQWGLEWLVRLSQEPTRLWRRYLLLNPLYCLMVAAQWLRLPGIPSGRERSPRSQQNFG